VAAARAVSRQADRLDVVKTALRTLIGLMEAVCILI
jgi:hypothetical protein